MRLSRDSLDADSALQLAAEADWVSASAGPTMVFAATHSAGNAFELVAVNRAGRDVRVLKPSAPIMSATHEISRWRRAVAYRDSRWTGRHLGIALVAEDERTAVSENWRQSDSRAALVGSRERWALGNGRQRGAALRRPPCRRPWRLRRLTGRPHAVSGPSSAREDGSAHDATLRPDPELDCRARPPALSSGLSSSLRPIATRP